MLLKNNNYFFTYLSTTTTPSKTLNPLLMYPNGPSAIILSNISTAKTAENTILLTSTTIVNCSGCRPMNRKKKKEYHLFDKHI